MSSGASVPNAPAVRTSDFSRPKSRNFSPPIGVTAGENARSATTNRKATEKTTIDSAYASRSISTSPAA